MNVSRSKLNEAFSSNWVVMHQDNYIVVCLNQVSRPGGMGEGAALPPVGGHNMLHKTAIIGLATRDFTNVTTGDLFRHLCQKHTTILWVFFEFMCGRLPRFKLTEILIKKCANRGNRRRYKDFWKIIYQISILEIIFRHFHHKSSKK